ncbi:hypothetical protein HHK36_017539 [Tetracentron sinense]|uniref:NDH-dependent cyclic electron flow 5 n=1 Tax=Tetracentron sinense TaxID=13715 RepID=A0A835DCQ0_TETSI|nr:hypothetical protein HHK36_017539 [Tetracentron sinense]
MASLLSFSLPNLIKASSSTTATTTSTPPTLDQKFGRKGIKFTESGDVPVVELTVRNGSSVRLRIPDGLVTSYKPKVYWKDDGFEEVLCTVPGGTDSIKGGIGLVLNDVSEPGSKGSPLCTSEWVVKDVDSDSIDALQVELGCTCGNLDINYIVSLYPLSMVTAVVVKNNGRKAVNLTSAILSHFKFKSRRGSAIQGLKGCSYRAHPPLSSSFGILSPAEAMKPEPSGWFSFGSESEIKEDSWTVEDELYTILRNKLSRVYTAPPMERLKRIYNTPPTKYETIDQGSGLIFRVIRMGYDDIYLASPGSLSQKYGKDYFICTGPASMLVPVVVNPGEGWRGAQLQKAMTMACTVLFSPSFTPQTSINPIKHLNSIHPSRPSNLCHYGNKKDFTLLALASSSYTPINVDYLEREFSGHGVSFAEIGDSCVVRMGLENGSIASLMLPSGLITSYKAPMWHGGMLEVLHTSVSKGEENIGAIVQGGISVCFKCGNDDGVSWSPSIWALHDENNRTFEMQVELISRDSEDMVEVKYIVTLQSDVLSSELVFSNLKPSTLQLMGSFISHLTVSTPDATYAVGLEGSNYFSRPPFMSDFSIIPPVFGQTNATGSIQSWGQTTLKGLLSNLGVRGQKDATESKQEEEIEGEENDNYAQLTEKMSRIYTSAPRSFTVIDRGRRNSVVVGREGLDEIYMFSPGSNHEWYSKYAYVCVGPSAMLKPIILGPGGTWRGMQYLHNPNL